MQEQGFPEENNSHVYNHIAAGPEEATCVDTSEHASFSTMFHLPYTILTRHYAPFDYKPPLLFA